jgi:spoIIIJ-associated protein
LVSEVRQEGYAGPVSEDASELGPDASVPGPDGSQPDGSLGPTQGSQDAGGDRLAADHPQDAEPEDPGPEAGAGLVPDEPAEADDKSEAELVPDDADDDADDAEADDEDNPLDTEAEIAADYLEELLDIADLDGDIDTYIEGDRAHVSIVSESEILVGPNGEVLDALQELARLAVMSETGGRSRLMLDIAGYRDRRRKELISLANDAVQEARETNERVPLAPMNPFERKIVHDAVVLAGLTSASEGEEPKRHVVIHPVS